MAFNPKTNFIKFWIFSLKEENHTPDEDKLSITENKEQHPLQNKYF